MKKIGLTIISFFTFLTVSKSQIAITEFMSNAIAEDSASEWVELFNYSSNSVDINGWSLVDEDSDSILISNSSFVIPSGGYVLLASSKDSIELRWFGGSVQSNILDYDYGKMAIANSGDELILKNNLGAVVWSLAYSNDEIKGVATFLEYSTDFNTVQTVWGSKTSPGIIRSGNDVGLTSEGYAGDTLIVDTLNVNNLNGDIQGSPLAGQYTVIGSSSINDWNDEEYVIFPNPFKNEIRFSKNSSGIIYNLGGTIVKQFDNIKSISVSELESGVYFIKTNDSIKKMIKH